MKTIKNPVAEQLSRRRHPDRGGILLFALALACLISVLYFTYAPPLLRSQDLSVSYAIAGVPHRDAELFQPLFMRGLYYVRLPAMNGRRYEWFLANYNNQRVQVPHWPRRSVFGFRHIHRDQAFGIDLLLPKMEDNWHLSFTPDVVDFSNQTIQVRVTN